MRLVTRYQICGYNIMPARFQNRQHILSYLTVCTSYKDFHLTNLNSAKWIAVLMRSEYLCYIITGNETCNNMNENIPLRTERGKSYCYELCLSERRWRVVPSDVVGFGTSAEECGWGGVKTEVCCEALTFWRGYCCVGC